MTGSLWSEALEVLRRDRLAMACAALLALVALAAIAGPSVLDYREDEIDWAHMAAPPFEAPGHLRPEGIGVLDRLAVQALVVRLPHVRAGGEVVANRVNGGHAIPRLENEGSL